MTRHFLRVPPFPGSRSRPIVLPGASTFTDSAIVTALISARVGGSFWSVPVSAEPGREIILVPDSPAQLAAMLELLPQPSGTIVGSAGGRAPPGFAHLPTECDPWHLADQAREVWAAADCELATVAALLGRPVRIFGGDRPLDPQPNLVAALLAALATHTYVSPFDGEAWGLEQVIEQLGEWRRLIAGNRGFQAIFGVARWKRVTVDPLLWGGDGPVPHAHALGSGFKAGRPVAAWKSRTPPAVLSRLEEVQCAVAEIEDGMIRSVGLGSNCFPPLSIFADMTGVYFDPNRPSDLENLLEHADLPPDWIARAGLLRNRLVDARISKYGLEQGSTRPVAPTRVRVLVTGQVEDDRSVLSGGANCTNLELIARARAIEPDAWIIYKPHPDVEAGHRKGHVHDAEVLAHADEIDRRSSIIDLIDQVDALHVITSLAGFEALLRGRRVTTHGQPFYAGWGLTRDLGPPNPRRTRKRNLDELVAATLIAYPRYVDPVTRLPCPPEVLIGRIVAGEARVRSPLIAFRQWEGRIRLAWQRVSGNRR